jgi:hypothetical protein
MQEVVLCVNELTTSRRLPRTFLAFADRYPVDVTEKDGETVM